MENIIEKIKEVNSKEEKTLIEMVLKLSEEIGEVAEAVLGYKKTSGSEYKNKTKDDIIEECSDVLILSLGIILKLEPNINKNLILDKINKWEEKQNK